METNLLHGSDAPAVCIEPPVMQGLDIRTNLQNQQNDTFFQCQVRFYKIFSSLAYSITQITLSFPYTRCNTILDVASWRSLSPQLAQRNTMQGCIGGESMATCVNMTNLGIKLTLPRWQTETSTNRFSGRFYRNNCTYYSKNYFVLCKIENLIECGHLIIQNHRVSDHAHLKKSLSITLE